MGMSSPSSPGTVRTARIEAEDKPVILMTTGPSLPPVSIWSPFVSPNPVRFLAVNLCYNVTGFFYHVTPKSLLPLACRWDPLP